jgi:hypothetical protein
MPKKKKEAKPNTDIVDSFGSPGHWIQVITDDLKAPCRQQWFDESVAVADQLIRNEFDAKVSGVDNRYWFKTGSYIRKVNYLDGRLDGLVEPKVTGTEVDDMDTALMYQHGVRFEFNRPRGLKRKVGRRQVRKTRRDWINYGLGAFNTYFDSHVKNHENPTGSIINEHVDATSIILDSTASCLDEINHFSRKRIVTEWQVRAMFPHYKGEIPLDDNKRSYLYEVQFRISRPVTMKNSSSDVARKVGDTRPQWKMEDEALFVGKYVEKNEGSVKERNKEAKRLWDSLGDDYASMPMAYSLIFLANGMGDPAQQMTALVQGMKYLGQDFSITLTPFLELPGTPYPVGLGYYMYDITTLETILKTLYVRQVIRLNNSGGVINVDKLAVGADDIHAKIAEIQKVSAEYGYYLPVSGVNNMNEVFMQLRQNEPSQTQVAMAEQCRYEGDEFFATHREMSGQAPFSGASGELTKVLQAAGSVPLIHMVGGMDELHSNIFRKTAYLIYEYMPPEKRIAISDLPNNIDTAVLRKEQMQKYNPNDLDITAELNLESEQEKINKANKAMLTFDRGMMDPETFLKDMGYRDYQSILNRLNDFQTGQQIVELLKTDKDLAAQFDAAIKAKALEAEDKERGKA